MIKFKGLNDNFQFLVLEIKNQVSHTYAFLNNPDPELQEKIISKDDYIDNLKNVVENDCFAKIISELGMTQKELNTVRAMQTIAVNLERIADFCVNIVRQVHYLSNYEILYEFDLEEMIKEISHALESLSAALKEKDLNKSLSICKSENNLDQMYERHFNRIMQELKDKKTSPGDLITILFIVRYFERIGDSLLNIGEAIIFSIIGEKIKINQFQALQNTLSQSGVDTSWSDLDFSMFWGNRSGCRIGKVENTNDFKEKFQNSIFKEGDLNKIEQEKQNLEAWESTFPSLVPRRFGFDRDPEQNKASLLLELIPGCTLEQAILTADQETLENALFIFQETLMEIWNSTKLEQASQTDYIKQILERKDSVLQVHPQFNKKSKTINNLYVNSLEKLLKQAHSMEQKIYAPFQVFIHGDLNINNIVYNHNDQKVHFVDLYRSKYYDYVQDLSVFLISNFRLPVFEKNTRVRIKKYIKDVLACSREFAKQNRDKSFEFRLALAIARSLFTSTRFELNKEFSQEMFLRFQYILNKTLTLPIEEVDNFEFPEEILYYNY